MGCRASIALRRAGSELGQQQVSAQMAAATRELLLLLLYATQVWVFPCDAWTVGLYSDLAPKPTPSHERRQGPRNPSVRTRGSTAAIDGRARLTGPLGVWMRKNQPLQATNVQNEVAEALSDEAVKTIISAMNTLPDDVLSYIMAYTPLGATARQKNAITAGAFLLESPRVIGLDGEGMDVSVTVRTRSFFGQVKELTETVRVPFQAEQPLVTSEAVKRRLMEMSREQGRTKTTAVIYKIPVGNYGGLPQNMLLNNVPHSKLARSFIYQGAAEAVVNAVQDPSVPRRMKLVCTVPELNPSMDTYRVGTMLEMVRELAYSLADVGLNTRILVQPSMGDGVFKSLPLVLSGVMAILQGMDWEEGLVGEHVNFGELGNKADITADDDVVLVISPQSITGFSIHQLLVDTVEEAAGRPVIIINPNLKDRPSSGGVMQVRGRGDRMTFAESFKDVYNFRLVYASSVAFFPIKGAVMKAGPLEPYVVFVRQNDGKDEIYNPLGTFDDDPDAENITPLFGRSEQW